MRIRETINEKRRVAVIIAIVVILVCGALAAWQGVRFYKYFFGRRHTDSHALDKCYYAAEDGSGVFIDNAKNVPPFEHDGKLVYRALLFKGADHKPFVQHLESYDEDGKKDIERKISATGQPPLLVQSSNEAIMHMLIRRPSDPPGKWTKPTENKGEDWAKIMTPDDKNGAGPFSPVSVEEDAHP